MSQEPVVVSSPRASRVSPIAAIVAAVAAGLAVAHSAPAAPPVAFRPMTKAQGEAFYKAAAENEVKTRKKAEGRFRGSPWSRDDDFHAKEAKFMRGYARGHKLTLAPLVDALGRGMHEGWPTPEDAVPDQKILACRPRLSY